MIKKRSFFAVVQVYAKSSKLKVRWQVTETIIFSSKNIFLLLELLNPSAILNFSKLTCKFATCSKMADAFIKHGTLCKWSISAIVSTFSINKKTFQDSQPGTKLSALRNELCYEVQSDLYVG